MGLTRAARDAPSMSRGSALAATLPEPCAPPSRRRAFPLPARSAPAAHFAASTPDVSRETSVLAPRLAHDSGSSSMPPLTVEASVGSRSAVTFPPPDVRQKPSFWQSFPGFRRDRAPPPRFRAAKPQVGFFRGGKPGAPAAKTTVLPHIGRWKRHGRSDRARKRPCATALHGGGRPFDGGGSGAMRQIEVRASVRVAAQLPKWMRVKSAFE
ncbi:hypothetical protein HMPREF9458_00294 [Eggerthella lenta 1_1_60AFAA]|nr:hypothetical protein HMPREF9458_00294 [Eggerthella lenta 1_1_60AFAA]